MRNIKSLFTAAALCAVMPLSAQTLKMTNQVVRVTAYEAQTAVNLVVVKPEAKLETLDPKFLLSKLME